MANDEGNLWPPWAARAVLKVAAITKLEQLAFVSLPIAVGS
jgi:hypothetical protein